MFFRSIKKTAELFYNQRFCVELMSGFEPETSSLPRRCSTY